VAADQERRGLRDVNTGAQDAFDACCRWRASGSLWKGAKIHAKPGRAGITALSEAVETGKEYSVRLLSQYGLELEALVTGEQSLGLATSRDISPRCGMGAKGAKVDGDCKLSSSLILAVENGHHCAMRALLELGASVDAVHTYNNTALKAAAHNGHLEAVRVLLDRGASVEEYPKGKGKAAVAKAVKYEHWDVAQLLRSRGAEPGVNYETFQQAQRKVPQLDSVGNVSWI
jgi:ankyrin repeat protein